MQIETNKLNNQMANLTDMLAKFVTANTASTSGSGTLPGMDECLALPISVLALIECHFHLNTLQESSGFTDKIASGNFTPYYDPIDATSSPTQLHLWDSGFLHLEEADLSLV
ncbi:hypothetical protein Tco_0797929 [Tanacetum coccineum]